MKSLLVAAFVIGACAMAQGQQIEAEKAQPAQKTEEKAPFVTSGTSIPIPEPLYVLSEGGMTRELSVADLEKLNITQIASIEVITDEESTREYGEKGKNGVLIISLKETAATN
jgi:hypothetical protein